MTPKKIPDDPEQILEKDPIPIKWIMIETIFEIFAGIGMLPLMANEIFGYKFVFTTVSTEVWFASCGILFTTAAIMQQLRTRDTTVTRERIIFTLLSASLAFLISGFHPAATLTSDIISISLLPALVIILRHEHTKKDITN